MSIKIFKKTTLISLLATFLISTFSLTAFAQEKPYIALISKGFQHQFWQAVKLGDGEGAVDRQLDMISTVLSKKPAAVAIAAIDSQATIPLLKQAQKADVIVLAFDSGVDSDIPITNAATNNLASAAMAADKMAEKIGNKGKVAVVSFDQTSQTGIERRDGFVDQIKKAHPNVEIVAIEYGGGDHLKSAEITKTLLLAHPDLKGIFGTNEGSAIGVAIGKKEVNSDIVVIGYDSGAAQIAAVRDGTIDGAITQNPVGMGYKTVEAAVKAIKGEKVEKFIDTGFFYYDKTNIDDPKIAAVLYD